MTMMCVFGRLISQLADVKTTVGMLHFHDVLSTTKLSCDVKLCEEF